MTDGRGVTHNSTYDSRGLLTHISFSIPDDPNNPGNPLPGVKDPGSVSLQYDDIGNIKELTDGVGTIDYLYTEFSQIESETREFNDSLTNKPTGNYKISYQYTRGGALKSIKDPFDDQIDYSFDKVGRLTSVDGSASYGGFSSYALSPHFRAWSALQSLEYGNGVEMNITGFNSQLSPDGFSLSSNNGQTTLMSKSYEYYADGKIRKLDDNIDYAGSDPNSDKVFDRLITYDHQGRPKSAKSGPDAHGISVAQADKKFVQPYKQEFVYDSFGRMTDRTTEHWGENSFGGIDFSIDHDYQNGRISNSGWQHDNDGRVLSDTRISYKYDASGALSDYYQSNSIDVERSVDGQKMEAKRDTSTYSEDENGNGSWENKVKYFVRSSVLGGAVLSELDETGAKRKTFVYAGGTRVATQNLYNGSVETVTFNHSDPSGYSVRTTLTSGSAIEGAGGDGSPIETDPRGGNVGKHTPFIVLNTGEPNEFPGQQPIAQADWGNIDISLSTIMIDGLAVPQWAGEQLMASGSVVPCPENQCLGLSYGRGGVISQSRFTPILAFGGYLQSYWEAVSTSVHVEGEPPPLPSLDDWVLKTRFVKDLLGPSQPLARKKAVRKRSMELKCPLGWRQILRSDDGAAIWSELERTWEDAQTSGNEEGGWVYMNQTGRLKIKRSTKTSGTVTYLGEPPIVAGYQVIANFHSHDADSQPSISVPGFVIGDIDLNKNRDMIPGLILGPISLGGDLTAKNLTIYGPRSGYFGQGRPVSCDQAAGSIGIKGLR